MTRTNNRPSKWIIIILVTSVVLLFSHKSAHSQWTSVVPPAVSDVWSLNGVHFTSANEGWAVGEDAANADNERGVLLHYQNGTWSSVTPPNVSGCWYLFKVHFTSANEGWAVGADMSNNKGVLLHYQNGTWSSVPPPDIGEYFVLRDVHFTSADEGWAVGYGGSVGTTGVLLHYQNGAWSSVTPPNVSGVWDLMMVHFTSADEGWAIGCNFSTGDGVFLHYQNGTWTSEASPNVSTGWELLDVHFTSANEGWAVGTNYYIGEGVLLHYQNETWTSVTPPIVSKVWDLRDVHFASANEGWAVGQDAFNSGGVILHYQNGIWTSVTQPGCSLEGVHFTSANEGWAVGVAGIGVLLHYYLPPTPSALTVEKSGNGAGTITSNPAGISCGLDCSEEYVVGQIITLTATADTGSEFTGWSGGGCAGTGTCEVTMNAEVTVTATFTLLDSSPNLSPIEGTIGTQIIITGIDFGIRKGKILIGGLNTKIIRDDWKSDSVTCTVKKVSFAGIHEVMVKPYKKTDIVLPNAFTIKPPEIESLSDYNGVAGISLITITGKFFSSKKGKVYFEYEWDGRPKKKYCKITDWSMDSITFIVPKISKRFPASSYPLKVVNKVGIAGAPSDFTID